MRQKDLEIQAQLMLLDQQRKAQEMESSKSHQLTRQVSTFSQTETELRSQLNIYVEKFKQVRASQPVVATINHDNRVHKSAVQKNFSNDHSSRSKILSTIPTTSS